MYFMRITHNNGYGIKHVIRDLYRVLKLSYPYQKKLTVLHLEGISYYCRPKKNILQSQH
jgi:hypothetical protein